MPLTRVTNWRTALATLLAASAEATFAWGTFDCALHVCNCIRAITDVDPGSSYRGKYSDETGAIAIFGSSLATFAAGIAASLGCAEVSVTFARQGDVVWIDNNTEYGALGVIALGGRFASCATDKGIVLVPMKRWKRAWMIG